ncbi:MAG: hypothetical protein KIH01_06215 [Candidatus Freyarchaeota archaeon]|nr:hypothetical protein [Candidatus Jordarchaeia archaeon]
MGFMADRAEFEIFSKAVRIYLDWANKNIPGFQALLLMLQDEFNVNSQEEALREILLNPEKFYNAIMKQTGSTIVAESHLYLIICSFIDLFKLPFNATTVVKVMRKGRWDELRELVRQAGSHLSEKI